MGRQCWDEKALRVDDCQWSLLINDHIEGGVDALKGKQEEKALEWKVKVILQILLKLIIPAWLQSLHWRIIDIERFLQLPLQYTGTVPHLFASFYLYLLHKIGPPTCGCTSRSDGPFMLVEGTKEKKWEWKVTVIFPILFASFSFYLLHYLGLPTFDCSRWSDGPFCLRKNCSRKKIVPENLYCLYLLHFLGVATCDCARWSNGLFFLHGWEGL